ncbi:MAG: RHS repeat protein, partial [Phycisphaeraceae bacterium]|nr:RHS repeat protein [Phycisphaeraceae bacterium]
MDHLGEDDVVELYVAMIEIDNHDPNLPVPAPPAPLPYPDGFYAVIDASTSGDCDGPMLNDVAGPLDLFAGIPCAFVQDEVDGSLYGNAAVGYKPATPLRAIIEPAFHEFPENLVGDENGETSDGSGGNGGAGIDEAEVDCGDGGADPDSPADAGEPSPDDPQGGGTTTAAVYLVTGHKVEQVVDVVVPVTGPDYRIVRGYSSDPDLHTSSGPVPGLVGANWQISSFRRLWRDAHDYLHLSGPPMHKFRSFEPQYDPMQTIVGWGPGGRRVHWGILELEDIEIDGDVVDVYRLSEPGGGFLDFNKATRNIAQWSDSYGNRRIYKYRQFGDLASTIRLSTIYLNGTPGVLLGPDAPEAVVEFDWIVSEANPAVRGRLGSIEVYRFDAQGHRVLTQTCQYRYAGQQGVASHGDVGASDIGLLIEVVHRTLLDGDPSEEDSWRTRITQYRYHETETAGTELDDRLNARGQSMQLEMIIQPEQIEFFANAWGIEESEIKTMQEAADILRTVGDDATDLEGTGIELIDLCAKIVDYDNASNRVSRQWVQSSCGCGGGAAQGVQLEYDYFSYDWAGGSSRPGMTARITESIDDGTGDYLEYRTWYYDFERLRSGTNVQGKPYPAYMVSRAIADSSGETSRIWAKAWDYVDWDLGEEADNSEYGNLLVQYTPSAVTSYVPCDEVDEAPDFTADSTAGLAYTFGYNGENRRAQLWVSKASGGYDLIEEREYVESEDYEWHVEEEPQYFRTDLIKTIKRYRVAGGTADHDIEVTSFSYGFFETEQNALAYVKAEVEREIEAENGPSGTENTVARYELFDARGNNVWSAHPGAAPEELTLTHRRYMRGSGRLSAVVRNAMAEDPGELGSEGGAHDLPTSHAELSTDGWGTASDASDELVTVYDRDLLGRVTRIIAPGGVARYTRREMRCNSLRSGTLYLATIDLPHRLLDDSFDSLASVNWVNAGGQAIRSSDYTLDPTEEYDPLAGLYEFESTPIGQTPLTDAPQGEVSRRVVHHSIAGLVTQIQEWEDVSGGAWNTTSLSYDSLGRLARRIDPNGTITEHEYDVMDRVTRVRVGRDESGSEYDPVTVLEHFYDSAQTTTSGVGNGSLTLVRQHENGSTFRDTKQYFDHRDRLIAVEAPSGANTPDQVFKYDNLDRLIVQATYAAGHAHALDEIDPATTNTDRGSYMVRMYSQRGLVYKERTAINPAAGSPDFLESNTWFDDQGRVIAQWGANGPAVKRAYDAHGRATVVYVTDRADDELPGASGNYADAVDVAGDHIIEQTEYQYSPAGRVTGVSRFLRRHDDTSGTGALDENSAVAMYTGFVYDDALRRIGTVQYGTNTANDLFEISGEAPELLTSLPDRATNPEWLIESVTYDTRGMMLDAVDPAGKVTRLLRDDLGRTAASIENFDPESDPELEITWDSGNGRWTVSDGLDHARMDTNRVTSYVYDGVGNVVKQVAHLAVQDGYDTIEEVQVTRYVYGTTNAASPGAIDSLIASRSLLREVHYPDESTGEPGTTDAYKVFYGYNRLGELRGVKDQNGTIHVYERDAIGRVTADIADTLGSGISGWARRLGVSYDPLGRLREVTTYSDTSGTTAINGVKFTYNGLWQVEKVFQDHNSAVTESSGTPTGDTRVVTYDYDQADWENGNYSRLASLGYPASDGAPTVFYGYGSGTIGDRVSRIAKLRMDIDDDTSVEDIVLYDYVGMGIFAVVDYAVPDFGLDRTVHLNGERESGVYPGFDRHGRVLRQMWVDGGFDEHASNAAVPNIPPIVAEVYAYDASSNRISKHDARPGAHLPNRDWNYTYDDLDRLVQADRGAAVT